MRFRQWVLAAAALALAATLCAAAGTPKEVFEPRPSGSWRDRFAVPEDSLYKSPLRLLLSPDGKRLFVACEGTDEVLVVDPEQRKVVGHVRVGRFPFGMVQSPDGERLYVSNRWDNTVSVVDLASMTVEKTFPVGDDPHGLALSADGRYLFVLDLSADDLRAYDLSDGCREAVRLSMGRAPFDLAWSPDRRRLYVSNQYSLPVPFRTPSILELTVVDAVHRLVQERRQFYSTVIGQGVAVSPDGRFVATALELPKNLIPETQVYQGWMVTYGFALTETRPGGRTAYLLIDEPNLYFADPYGIAFTPDGRFLYVSSSGANEVTVVDMAKVDSILEVRGGRIGIPDSKIRQYARDLGISSEYVAARIPTGYNPKDLVVSPDGRWVYVAERLEDRILVIDARARQAAGTIDLGGPKKLTMLRKGARLFNYASISFQKQMSCATCHPEEHVDGLSYDIAVDGGMGHNLVDNRTLRGIANTAPFKWSGKNPNLYRQEGPRAAQLFFRTQGFQGAENEEMVEFIESIPIKPNRYRAAGKPLNAFQAVGKKLFERAYDNLGRYIPTDNRCVTCHPPPYGTDKRQHDVGTKNYHDLNGTFDTPALTNTYENGPWLHDGRCNSLEEIWTRFNPYDTHGMTNDMTKDQLNALVEYIKTF